MKKLLPLFAIFGSSFGFSQAPYTFSTYTEDYLELQGGNPIDVFDVTATTWDDPEFSVPLNGFDILGQVFNSTTQVGVGSLMGFLDDNNIPLHGFGLDVDIMDGAVLEGNEASEITYSTFFTGESTTTIIQFSNVAFYDEIDSDQPGTVNRMSFQIQFDTPSNAMSIHFGPSNIPNPELVFYGPGPSILLGVGVDDNTGVATYGAQLSGDPANPTLTETFNSEPNLEQFLNSMPQSGRVYRFEPGTNDIAESEKPLFSISPTLTTEFINVVGDIKPNFTYRIFDLSGKEVRNGLFLNNQPIDVSYLESGFYLFSIDGMNGSVKFIKQ